MLRALERSAHCTIHRSTKSKHQNVTRSLRTIIPIASCITYGQTVAPSGTAANPTSRVRNDSPRSDFKNETQRILPFISSQNSDDPRSTG